MTDLLAQARAAYQRRDWRGARAGFVAAGAEAELGPEDLSALADTAWWLGDTEECLTLSEEVYRHHLHGARVPRAARLALEIGMLATLRGDVSVGSGWISRAQRLLQDEQEGPAHGFLLFLECGEATAQGDYEAAVDRARRARQIGDRFQDPDITALGLVSEGIVRVRQGRVADGTALLDEAMLPVVAGHVSPNWAGNLYCQIMQVCHELADLRRAREWTDTAERWCAGFPSAVMFTGICRVHRAQLLQLEGHWQRAEQEARGVCDELAAMNVGVVALAHYQVGQVRRLSGDLTAAEEAYRRAHELGRDPQPGLALLRVAQGRTAAAAGLVETALLAESTDRFARARLRAAQAEIALVAGDPDVAREAADELDEIAQTYGSSGLAASAQQARGTALLSAGDAAAALPVLREACRRWRELDAPYLAAGVRVLLARACAVLGDRDAAEMELDTAGSVFDELGARVDARAVARLRGEPVLPAGLTGREAEVLAMVAGGSSNREIADALVISGKTVARHLSNIFSKIGVSSRAEAAAYAVRHGLGAPAR